MRYFITAWAFAVSTCFGIQAAYADSEDIAYTMLRGDTLITISKKYLSEPKNYWLVQKHNLITDPLKIPVGRVIKFPRSLLKYKPAMAKLLSVRGTVIINTKSQAIIGQILSEGSRVATAESSFATLLLDNGSRLSLPSNSDLRITRLRTYAMGGSLDYDFDLGKGGTRSSVIPLKSKDDRYRVRTPKAVSAVRGTDFQARFDSETNSDFAEVIEGKLEVGVGENALPQEALALPAGNGLAVPKSGKPIREALLPEPALIEPGRMQSDRLVNFTPGIPFTAGRYRYTLSTDAGFVDQIADVIAATNPVAFSDIGDGNYFVRARAISASGIQGLPATYAFKRRLNVVSANAGKSDDGFAFKWTSEGNGVSRYHFQLFKGSRDGVAMVDEAALRTDQIILSDLPAGVYYWRIGSVQYQEGEVSTNWTSFEKLSVGVP